MSRALKPTFSLVEFESENYQQLFDAMTSSMALHEILLNDFGTPEDYRFLAVNPAYEKVMRLSGQNLVGRKGSEIFPEMETYWVEVCGRVALTGQSVRFEYHHKSLDQYFEVQVFSPEKGKFGCIFHDVSESRRMRELLERSERRFRTLVESMGDVISLYDNQGKMTYVSPRYQEIFHSCPENLIGKTLLEAGFPSELSKLVHEKLQKTLAEKREYSCCVAFPHPKLGMRAIEIRFFPVCLDEEVISLISQARDVSEWVKLEGEKENLKKQVEDLEKKAEKKGMTRILIIDDEPCICFILGSLLSDMGHTVDQATSGEDALELLKIKEYDFILTDYKMPLMNGDEFVYEAKKRYPQRKMRFISVSGDIEGDPERGRIYDGFIDKPFNVPLTKTLLTKLKI